MPVMHVVAGPPGGGKSTAFPVREAGFDYFDADARASQLHGSYAGIPPAVRAIINAEFEMFIESHIADRRSFTFETTLRSSVTFEQAHRARAAGFTLSMTYVALASVEHHIERVAARADAGGHSAPVSKIREIYAASMNHLRRALREFDLVAVYDNSRNAPELVLDAHRGTIRRVKPAPAWISSILA